MEEKRENKHKDNSCAWKKSQKEQKLRRVSRINVGKGENKGNKDRKAVETNSRGEKKT